jgi:very-long-chain (3R)-3-hydroxyacyl-CoA dehydratase
MRSSVFCSYAAIQAGVGVKIATWLRYSAFIPVYPAGMICELAAIWIALPRLERGSPFDVTMPNAANITFRHATFERAILIVQPLLWLQLYSTLLRQRSKRLPAVRTPEKDGKSA